MNAIGENVKLFRELRKLTQAALGEKAAMTQQNVARIEKGETIPPIPTLLALANALDVTLPELVYDFNKFYSLDIDVTHHYSERMKMESEDVQVVMKRALDENNGKIIVVLKLSQAEQEMYKMCGYYKDPVKFWEFLDGDVVRHALNAPAEYVWCLKKLNEFGGNKKRIRKAMFDRFIERNGLRVKSNPFPHHINVPWLCFIDTVHYWSLIGIISEDKYLEIKKKASEISGENLKPSLIKLDIRSAV